MVVKKYYMLFTQAADSYLERLFEDCVLCAVHARRKTVLRKDMNLAWRIREEIPDIVSGEWVVGERRISHVRAEE